MGLFKKFSSGSAPRWGEPQPHKFKVLLVEHHGDYTVVQARYDGCSEYDGVKIMVYEGHFTPGSIMDPHFLENAVSPIARFAPNEAGYKALERLIGPTE